REIISKIYDLKDDNIQLVLWDLAGHEKYSIMRHQFYQDSVGVLIVYDITNRKSFQSVKKWYEDIKENLGYKEKAQIILCGNKKDLETKRVVQVDEGKTLAQQLGIPFFETSARTGENITEVFDKFIDVLLLGRQR
ncbi:MAG: member RAS oncogene family, partial [Promethearchaeota archaeon CR_4]